MTVPHEYTEKTLRNMASPNWWKLYILIVYMNRNIVGDYGGELDWQTDPFRIAPPTLCPHSVPCAPTFCPHP